MVSTFQRSAYDANAEQVSLYVVHLHNENIRSNTIRSHLSAISFKFQSSDRPSPTESFSTSKLLLAYAKSDPPPKIRKPLTKANLEKIIPALERMPYTSHERHMLRSLFTLMYHALLRISEVTTSKKNDHNLKSTQVKNSTSDTRKLSVTFSSFKFSKPGLTHLDILPSNGTACPVTAYARYTKIRPKKSKFAYCLQNGSPLSPSYVTNQLRSILYQIGLSPQDYNNHSFRIGKATDMARQGYTDTQICMAGRWSSSAFKKYIKPQLLQL